MDIGLITLLMFGSLLVLFFIGLPIAFTTGALAVIFTFVLRGPDALLSVALTVQSVMTNYSLVAIPMFIFMAAILENSGISNGLFDAVQVWIGFLKGGIAIAVLIAATIFAAMVGVIGASVVTMALIGLPAMLKYKYDNSIALGSICAGGALGILIPPSILLIFYGTIAAMSIGKLLMGGVFPGLLLSGLYILYVLIRSHLQPHLCPAMPKEERIASLRQKIVATRGVILPVLLILGVLGSIYLGVAAVTEAAGIGALGAIICAAIYRRLSWQNLKKASLSSLSTSSMVLWILFGATAFVSAYQGVGGPQFVKDIMLSLPLNRWAVLAITQIILLIMGFFIDPFGIILLTVPVFLPVITALGFDPLWFGLVFNVNMQIALLTPPFAATIFFLKGARPDIPMADMYRAVWPFCLLQVLGLTLCIVFPQIPLWLPNMMIK